MKLVTRVQSDQPALLGSKVYREKLARRATQVRMARQGQMALKALQDLPDPPAPPETWGRKVLRVFKESKALKAPKAIQAPMSWGRQQLRRLTGF